jgi:hypothetical protein
MQTMTNTSTKHTPGDWNADGHFVVASDPAGRHPDIYIAEVVSGDDEGRMATPTQQAANMRLIAAAPELLAALDYLLEQTVDMDLTYGIALTEGEADARQKAFDAIVKATDPELF